MGRQNNLLKLLSSEHFPPTFSFAAAIPEVQARNIIPVSVQSERYKKILFREKARENEGEIESDSVSLKAYVHV